jgi:DNA-binding LacI/PurR family transcriptional regulator
MPEPMIIQDSPLSIPVQLRDILLNEIRESKILKGKRFPSERVLAERYKVSRASVRETISELISLGVLFRTVGRGTFVADQEPKSKATRQIVFLISDDIFNFAETGYGRILRGVEDACRRNGSTLIFQSIGTDSEHVLSNELASVSGIVVVGGIQRPDLEHLRKERIPIVLVDPLVHTKFDDAETVNIDYVGGTKRAVERLHELGHRHIGFIGFPGSDKYDAYWQTSSALGLQYDPRIVEFLYSRELEPGILAGFRAMQRILSRDSLPTALLATNDNVARGAMEALQADGISVPDDVSIVGYDDFGLSISPPLSTIRADLEEVGRLAMEALIRRIETGGAGSPTLVSVDFVERSSSAPSRVHQLENRRNDKP